MKEIKDINDVKSILKILENEGKVPHITLDTSIDEIKELDFCGAFLGLFKLVIE